MVAYLAEGFFSRSVPRRLRTEVVDGAVDSAGFLHRDGQDCALVLRLALQVRALTGLVDPIHRHVHLKVQAHDPAHRQLTPAAKTLVRNRLSEATDTQVALQSFVLDCLDHTHDLDDLRGLYLHLVHIAQVMRLLAASRESAAVHALVAAHDELAFNAQGRLTRLTGR